MEHSKKYSKYMESKELLEQELNQCFLSQQVAFILKSLTNDYQLFLEQRSQLLKNLKKEPKGYKPRYQLNRFTKRFADLPYHDVSLWKLELSSKNQILIHHYSKLKLHLTSLLKNSVSKSLLLQKFYDLELPQLNAKQQELKIQQLFYDQAIKQINEVLLELKKIDLSKPLFYAPNKDASHHEELGLFGWKNLVQLTKYYWEKFKF